MVPGNLIFPLHNQILLRKQFEIPSNFAKNHDELYAWLLIILLIIYIIESFTEYIHTYIHL